MVDFNAEDLEQYIPRNLSDDNSYHNAFIAHQLYQEFKERRRQTDEVAKNMESEVPKDEATNGLTDSENKFYVPTTDPDPDTKYPSPFADSPLEPPDIANGNSLDLSSYIRDLSITSPGGASSDNDTVFSDDYTVMTDNGDGSEIGAGSDNVSKTSSFSSDVSSNFSDSATSTPSDVEETEEKEKEKGSPPPDIGSGKKKPDIKLLLSHKKPEEYQDTPSCSLSNSPDSPKREASCDNDCNYYEDREFDFLRTEPVKRSTSLKTYKTPPGTPSRKKAVRFADALGLDLESVRHILNMEEPPKVPASAMVDLKVGMEEERKTEGIRYLSASFAQPGASATFFQRIQAQKVLLENCLIGDKQTTVTGTVRVLNIAYHKKVTIRYTVNNWLTHTDIPASYVMNSNDGPTDRFAFSISLPNYFSVGSRMQFCIKYDAGSEEFWDSNYGGNYIVDCYAKASPFQDKNAWVSFL